MKLAGRVWQYHDGDMDGQSLQGNNLFQLVSNGGQVAFEVSPFRPLHPLPLDRRSSYRPVPTEIPRSWSALSGVNPQVMVTKQKGGSPPASTSLSYPFAIP